MPRPGYNPVSDSTILTSDGKLFEMHYCICSDKFRDTCRVYEWYKYAPHSVYDEALDLAQRNMTPNDLLKLSLHVSRHSSGMEVTKVMRTIVNRCCFFEVSELLPIPNPNHKSKFRAFISKLKTLKKKNAEFAHLSIFTSF